MNGFLKCGKYIQVKNYSALKEKKIWTRSTTWVKFEDVMLNEKPDAKDIRCPCVMALTCSTGGGRGGEGRGRGSDSQRQQVE